MNGRKKGKIAGLILLMITLMALLLGDRIGVLYRELRFRWSDATEAERKVKLYADEKGISFGEYPESLIALLDRNPETEEFVLNYPLWIARLWKRVRLCHALRNSRCICRLLYPKR